MKSRGLRILMLLWAAAWFGIIVPGHERGLIKLPGSDATETCPACAAPPVVASHLPGGKSTKSKSDPAAGCAICFLTAQLQTPPTVNLELPEVGLLRVLPVLPLTTLEGIRFISIVQERGPPSHLFA